MTKKNIMRASAAALAFCLLATAAPAMNADAKAKPKLNKKKITIKVGKTKKLKIKNLKGKKVKWKTSNKKVVKIKKTKKKTVVKLKGKKAGTATITAKIGKKKYKCKVTVKGAKKNNSSNKGSAREQEQARREQVEKQVDKKLTDAVNSVTTPQMKDQEKALKLALYVCDNLGQYYGKYWAESDVDSVRCIEGGKGTGLGYAEVYGALLDKVGIENFWVPANAGGLRTKLKIDGQWYNVDVCRMDGNDEEIHSGNRQLAYGFFMFSDQEAFKYHSYYYKPTVDSLKDDYPDATSTRFDFVESVFNAAKADDFSRLGNEASTYRDVINAFGCTAADYSAGDAFYQYNPWYTGEWVNY